MRDVKSRLQRRPSQSHTTTSLLWQEPALHPDCGSFSSHHRQQATTPWPIPPLAILTPRSWWPTHTLRCFPRHLARSKQHCTMDTSAIFPESQPKRYAAIRPSQSQQPKGTWIRHAKIYDPQNLTRQSHQADQPTPHQQTHPAVLMSFPSTKHEHMIVMWLSDGWTNPPGKSTLIKPENSRAPQPVATTTSWSYMIMIQMRSSWNQYEIARDPHCLKRTKNCTHA